MAELSSLHVHVRIRGWVAPYLDLVIFVLKKLRISEPPLGLLLWPVLRLGISVEPSR